MERTIPVADNPEPIDNLIQSLMNAKEAQQLDEIFGRSSVSGIGGPGRRFTETADFWNDSLRDWLVRALHVALRIEMTVIPPYLVAMWTVRRPPDIKSLLADVAKEEMLHMGLVCNTLAALGVDPPLTDPAIVPRFPTRLPAAVRPDILVELKHFSSELVHDVFVPIEEPSSAIFRWDNGYRYWTIGAFYQLLELTLDHAPDEIFSSRNQITLDDINLAPVTTPAEAAVAMKLIRVQGEGTPGPLFGSDPLLDVAHYFRFCEILNGARIKVHSDGSWSFTGDPLIIPKPADVFRIIRPADPNLAEAIAFDDAYSGMLAAFEEAWQTGTTKPLERATGLMLNLPILANNLFQATLNQSTGECHGPTFLLR